MTERADTLNNQAILFASDGQYSDAIACFRRAIHIDRENYLLWFNLGLTYRDSGDLVEAYNALKNAYGIAPDNEDVVETLAIICMNLHLDDEAYAFCFDGIDYHPTSAKLWNLGGVLHFRDEDFNTAAEYFEMAITINPFYLDALYNLRDTYEEQKNLTGVKVCEEQIKNIEGRK